MSPKNSAIPKSRGGEYATNGRQTDNGSLMSIDLFSAPKVGSETGQTHPLEVWPGPDLGRSTTSSRRSPSSPTTPCRVYPVIFSRRASTRRRGRSWIPTLPALCERSILSSFRASTLATGSRTQCSRPYGGTRSAYAKVVYLHAIKTPAEIDLSGLTVSGIMVEPMCSTSGGTQETPVPWLSPFS